MNLTHVNLTFFLASGLVLAASNETHAGPTLPTECGRGDKSAGSAERLVRLQQCIDAASTSGKLSASELSAAEEIARIRLWKGHRPRLVLKLFGQLKKHPGQSFEQTDVIDEWLAAAADFAALDPRLGPMRADELFEDATTRYEALRRAVDDGPLESLEPTDLQAAVQSLVAFIAHHDRDPATGEAMFMLGDLRSLAGIGAGLAGSSFYLKEAIRRRPRSRLAERAFAVLESNVAVAYSGSGGFRIPGSMQRMLEQFRALAHGS